MPTKLDIKLIAFFKIAKVVKSGKGLEKKKVVKLKFCNWNSLKSISDIIYLQSSERDLSTKQMEGKTLKIGGCIFAKKK